MNFIMIGLLLRGIGQTLCSFEHVSCCEKKCLSDSVLIVPYREAMTPRVQRVMKYKTVLSYAFRILGLGINKEELRGFQANPSLSGKWLLK